MATWKPLDHPLLPELLVPDGEEFIPLYSAAQWIALKGGFGPMFDPTSEEADHIWRAAFDELCNAIRMGRVRVQGRSGGTPSTMPCELFNPRFVSYPFRDMDMELFESGETFLQSIHFDDDEDWRSGTADTLWHNRVPIWTHIEVCEADVAICWPSSAWGRNIPIGRPPKRRVPVWAELDRLKKESGTIDNSIDLATRVMTKLNANVFKDDPVRLRVVQSLIAQYLRNAE